MESRSWNTGEGVVTTVTPTDPTIDDIPGFVLHGRKSKDFSERRRRQTIEYVDRFWRAFEALQEAKRDLLIENRLSQGEIAKMLFGWTSKVGGNDPALIAAVLDLEQRLVELRRAETVAPPENEWDIEPFVNFAAWIEKLARQTATNLPESIESARDILNWAEYYLALTTRPEDIEPWHRYEARVPILGRLFGAGDRVALVCGFERVAREFDQRSVGWFDEGSERADVAILQLRHATRKDMDLYFDGLVRPARDESYIWRRNHAAAILSRAFESESNSGWTERDYSFLVL